MMRNVLLFTVAVCTFQVFAQSNSETPSQQRLITLNVAATNSRDEPVTDLKVADVQLREDGKPQPIAFFRFAGNSRTTAPLAPGEFANYSAPTPVVILQMFSLLTGGRWYAGDNAAHALGDALIDGRGTYRLAYYSAAPEKDGKEYKIHLDTPRKGIHLLTREGFTIGAAAPAPEQVETAHFNNQIDSPFDASEIGLRVALSRPRPTGAVHFDIRVDPADVLIEHSGEQYHGKLDVVVAFYSGGLLKGTSPATRTDLNFTQAQSDRITKEGFSIPLNLPVGSDIQNARVMVFDPGLQALGSVTFPTK